MSALSELCQKIKVCTKCEVLTRGRAQVVPGDGAENAEIMFIGEAPGFHEDQEGRPFVGAAGQFLNQLIASISLKREEVYITNIIKCRPPGNRDPLPMEIQNCNPWLEQQIEIIKPKIIVTLGRYSMAKFLPGKTISQIHGTAKKGDGVIYFAMYHPAAALHQQSLRQQIEVDFCKISSLLTQVKNIPEDKPQPKQLNMFEV